MNWILRFYKIVFAGLFEVIEGIEQAKVMIVCIIDGFSYQFIVAMLSLSLLLYQGIGDQALVGMSAWLSGAGGRNDSEDGFDYSIGYSITTISGAVHSRMCPSFYALARKRRTI